MDGVPGAYVMRRPQLLEARLEDIVDAELWAALQSSRGAEELRRSLLQLTRHEFEDVHSLPFLRPAACAWLREEAEQFRAWCEGSGRPSPGLLLKSRWYFKQMDVRFDSLFGRLLSEVVRPLDEALFGSIASLAYHHDYCISYEPEADCTLKAHTDDSDVTVNVYLGTGTGQRVHEGSELVLLAPTEEDAHCGTPRYDSPRYQGGKMLYSHTEVGRALIHPGDRWHAVEPLVDGSRWNLLIWALRDDAAWKRNFFAETEAYLQAKANA